MTLTYDNLRARYPRFKWHYDVELGFWCEMRHPLYGGSVPNWYAHFDRDREIPQALRELDIIHDAFGRVECQGLNVESKHVRLSWRAPQT